MPIVYRIQDEDGRGPWRTGFSKKWVEKREDNSNLLTIYGDFRDSFYDDEELFELFIMRIMSHSFYGSGCESLVKLRRWFTESEYNTLKNYGYNCVELDVEKILLSSEIQCIFERKKPLNICAKIIDLY